MVQALDCNHYANIMKVMKTISEYFKRLHIEFSSFSPFVFIENLIVISFFVGISDRFTSSNEDGLDLLILCCKWGCWVWLLLIWINRKLHTVVSVVREHLFPKRRTYLEVELNHLDIHASCCQVKFKLLLVSHVETSPSRIFVINTQECQGSALPVLFNNFLMSLLEILFG